MRLRINNETEIEIETTIEMITSEFDEIETVLESDAGQIMQYLGEIYNQQQISNNFLASTMIIMFFVIGAIVLLCLVRVINNTLFKNM